MTDDASRIEALGDGALLIRLGDRIDDALNDAAIALSVRLRAIAIDGVVDVAPAYASVCVRYDIERVAYAALVETLASLLDAPSESQTPIDDLIEIPVCYADFGIDLDEVATHCGLDRQQVIDLHVAGDYRVAMLGFMPGFPYLRGLDARLHTPRRDTPRLRVPAGSVAIGGAQTGIYPRELPGGWRIIGRTPLALFDAARAAPALLAPGQRLRFRSIDADEFAALSR